jgi:hypothetical protein
MHYVHKHACFSLMAQSATQIRPHRVEFTEAPVTYIIQADMEENMQAC